MPLIYKGYRDKVRAALDARYKILSDGLEGSDLPGTDDGPGTREEAEAKKLCRIDSFNLMVAVNDVRTVLAEIEKWDATLE